MEVSVTSARGVDEVRARLDAALRDGIVPGIIGPEADAGQGRLRSIEGRVAPDGAVSLIARRIEGSGSASGRVPLVFAGRLAAAPGGSVLSGVIDAPVNRGLWLVPAIAMVLAAWTWLQGDGTTLLWLLLAAGTSAVFQSARRVSRRDAPQLRRALEALVAG